MGYRLAKTTDGAAHQVPTSASLPPLRPEMTGVYLIPSGRVVIVPCACHLHLAPSRRCRAPAFAANSLLGSQPALRSASTPVLLVHSLVKGVFPLVLSHIALCGFIMRRGRGGGRGGVRGGGGGSASGSGGTAVPLLAAMASQRVVVLTADGRCVKVRLLLFSADVAAHFCLLFWVPLCMAHVFLVWGWPVCDHLAHHATAPPSVAVCVCELSLLAGVRACKRSSVLFLLSAC